MSENLLVQVETWVGSKLEKFTWKWLSRGIIVAVIFILGAMVGGIIENKSSKAWEESVEPWLTTKSFSITNGLLLVGGLFCLFGWGFAFLLNGAEKRKSGQLEEIRNENVEKEKKIDDLNKELRNLRDSLQQSQQAVSVLGSLDRELLTLITQGNLDDKIIIAFFEGACRRLFKYLRGDSDVFRASIYRRDEQDREFLAIKWDFGVGEVSRRWNRWYIGDRDPETSGVHRGIPGEVFVKGEGRRNENVREDPDFYDPHQPPRSVLPYKAILHTVIHPNDITKRYGVFCIDSLTHKFTENDLEMAQQVAIRFGWLINQLQI